MATTSTGLLDGLRVLDMADEKGELCGRLLADLGANVVRVEPPAGAVSRSLPPFAPDGVTSLYFAYRNANKRGITLDLAKTRGRELLDRLLGATDIWVESQAPGQLAALGLDSRRVLERHPGLVIVSITDFGQDGPYRDFTGTDMVGFAMGGLMHRAGIFAKPPLVAPGALAYDAAGVTAAFAALTAYWKRLRTGRGQHLDVSVMEAAANISDWSMPMYSFLAQLPPRAGAGPLYPIYPCADGHVRMVIIGERHWRALRAWLGEPAELQGQEWVSFLFRMANGQILDPLIHALFRERKKVELSRESQARGIPMTPLLKPGEVMNNEHTRARGTFVEGEIAPGGIRGRIPAGFFHIDGERVGFRFAAPSPGQHDEQVFCRELGLSEAELASLRREGVVR